MKDRRHADAELISRLLIPGRICFHAIKTLARIDLPGRWKYRYDAYPIGIALDQSNWFFFFSTSSSSWEARKTIDFVKNKRDAWYYSIRWLKRDFLREQNS